MTDLRRRAAGTSHPEQQRRREEKPHAGPPAAFFAGASCFVSRRDTSRILLSMVVVSVTRLHLRSLRFFPQFFLYTIASMRQVRRAPGCLGGWVGGEGIRGFWTVTCWTDLEPMRAFRNRGPHVQAMRKLLHWCDEASFLHFEQESEEPPDAEAAHGRLGKGGRLSKVMHPSARHLSGNTVAASPPRRGASLHPVRR